LAAQIDKLLELAVQSGASDIHLSVGSPPVLRIDERLRPVKSDVLQPEDTVALMKSISSERAQNELDRRGGSDFAFAYGDKARFRVSIFRQKGCVGLVLRLLPSHLLTFEEIGLPPSIKNLLLKPRGLFLVTGPTGSGKTTTLATMVDFINTELDRHIVTIEDPIEYYHMHKRSLITQRELNVDIESFSEALKRVLRQDPDVILVGEMRDLETMGAAITAAETGHLVFATLHTIGAAETINRIVDAFPVRQQEQVRAQLSTCLLAVLSQTLLPRSDGGGRIAGFEIMVHTPAIAHLVRDNRTHQIISQMQTGRKLGMILLDDFLYELFQAGKIKFQDMLEKAANPEELQQKLKQQVGTAKTQR
jgi:twitching motility protein PilT